MRMVMSCCSTTTSSIAHLTSISSGIRRRSNLHHFNCFGLVVVVVPINRRSSRSRSMICSSRWNRAACSSKYNNQTVIKTSEEEEDESESESESEISTPPLVLVESASEVVRKFYGGINAHDLHSVEDLIAHNCVYEDLVFPQPFLGRKAILEFFRKFTDSISTDLQFVIDDISDEDTLAVGVSWHLEWKGKPFPFSKGCSFYRLDIVNGKRRIVGLILTFGYSYGRDCVEPAIKPGETALVAIRGVAWLLQKFPKLADWL